MKKQDNKMLFVGVLVVIGIALIIAIGVFAYNKIFKEKLTNYSDIDYLVVDNSGKLIGFSEYNVTKNKKIEYKDGQKTDKTYSAGDKTISLLEYKKKTTVVIPKTVRSIDNNIFVGNDYVKTVKIEMNIREVKDNMFESANIEKIILPSTVKTIGTKAFEGCIKLKEVSFDEKSSLEVIKDEAFISCSSLKKIDLKNVREIGAKAFYGCNSIKKVYLSSKLEKVGEEAFKYLANRSEIIVENVKVKRLIINKYTRNKTIVKIDHKLFK